MAVVVSCRVGIGEDRLEESRVDLAISQSPGVKLKGFYLKVLKFLK